MKKLFILLIFVYSNIVFAQIIIKGNIVSDMYPIYSTIWSKTDPFCNKNKCFPVKKVEISYLISNLTYDPKTKMEDRKIDLSQYTTALVPVNLISKNYNEQTGNYKYILEAEHKIKFYNVKLMAVKTDFVEYNANLTFLNEASLGLSGTITYKTNDNDFMIQNNRNDAFVFEKINHDLILKRTRDIPVTLEIL